MITRFRVTAIITALLLVACLAAVVVIIRSRSGKTASAEQSLSVGTAQRSGSASGGLSNAPIAPVEGVILKYTSLEETIEVSGTIAAMEETVLMSEVAGRVVSLNLPEGKTVQRGTLLVKLFDNDLQMQLKKLEVQLQIAEATEKRQRELLAINGISQQEYDISALQVSTLKAEIDIVKVQIGKTELRAPFTGRIGLRKISPGAYITPATPVATIRDDQRLKIDFSVPEKYGDRIRAGKKVEFAIAGGKAQYAATVMATEQGIQESTRNLGIRAFVNQTRTAHPELIPGAFATVRVVLGENKRALMVPSQSIVPQARDKRIIVARNGRAALVKVQTGVRQASNVQILDGVQEGDTVVTTGIMFIRPDAPLRFSKVTTYGEEE
jgi:membrane fusion protein (multidrug efflux system)